MVHASFAVSIEDIFLNFSFVTALKMAFNALLLKFVALIFDHPNQPELALA